MHVTGTFLTTALSALIAVAPATSAAAQAGSDAAEKEVKARAMFDKADTDKDGALTLTEWKALGRREQGFRFMDADKDGKLTTDEIRAAVEAYRQRR